MFAYCNNNPIVAADYNGKWLNFLIGAVVGAVVNAVVTAVDSYITTGSIDWADVGVSAATGAVTGAIAASGMGAIAQAGWTAAASAGGDLLQQGVDICQGQRESIDVGEIVDAGATGFATSVVGSAVGNIASKNTMDVGQALVDKGRGNALTGMLRKSVGQSHSSLIRNGSKLVSQGTKLVNRARGICSVVGTLATWRLNASFAARH